MNSLVNQATDARQTQAWADFMGGIGWKTEKVGNLYVYIRHIPLLNHSLIKIPHAKGPIPFDEIDGLAKRNKALFLLIQPSPIGHDENKYKENRYLKSSMQTAYTANILVDISPNEKELFKEFAENARRNIKKALANKIQCKTIDLSNKNNMPYFEEFYKLVHTVGKIKNFYTPPISEAKIKVDAFKSNEFLTLAYLDSSATPIAGIWFACVEKTVYYIQTGMTQGGYDKLANYLLLWEGMKEAKKRGATILDFEGIYDERMKSENKKWKGFTAFKERFHGEKVYYPLPKIKIYNTGYKLLYLCSSVFFK